MSRSDERDEKLARLTRYEGAASEAQDEGCQGAEDGFGEDP